MKKGLKAILLAAGLSVSMLASCVYAEEAATEATTEAATEVTADASAGTYAAYYETMKAAVPETLAALSVMSDEQLNDVIENGTDASMVAIAATWQSVKADLGSYVEVVSQEVVEDGNVITVNSVAYYDGVEGNSPVNVSYDYNVRDNSQSMSWEVDYPMSILMKQAGLNTVMGLGIVFAVLAFLSFLIAQIHWIPDIIEARQKGKTEAKPAPAPAPAAAPVVEEEEYVDDLELVAVIAAAIAASENTSTDAFVVRSIKKANRRKWQNA